MKARASNLMIGSMTLAVIAAAFIGLLGYRKIHGIAQQAPLRIVFEGSASGLRKGGNVNFDGVQVGEIKSLKLDNPRKVVALTLVDNSAPIRKDTVVGLEFQGLTGVAAISLTGGSTSGTAGCGRRSDPDRRPQRDRIDSRHTAQRRPDPLRQPGNAERCAAFLRDLYGVLGEQGRRAR